MLRCGAFAFCLGSVGGGRDVEIVWFSLKHCDAMLSERLWEWQGGIGGSTGEIYLSESRSSMNSESSEEMGRGSAEPLWGSP